MKILTVVLLTFLLIGCKEALPPKYNIGDEVLVVNKMEGVVIQTRTWVGTSTQPTADYKVMIGNSVTEWFDEEQVRLK